MFHVTALIKSHFQFLYNFYFIYLFPLLLNAQLQQQPASESAKSHFVLSFDSLKAPQSKCVLLSALLTVQSTLDRIKYSGDSMPLSKPECLNSQTSKLHNSNITDILETLKNELHHYSLIWSENIHTYINTLVVNASSYCFFKSLPSSQDLRNNSVR